MQELGKQLEALAQADSPAISRRSGDAAAGDDAPAAAAPGGQNGGGGAARGPLPGLQDLRGQWSGAIQAYGGGGGATAVEFNLRGRDWHWGVYELDQVGFICHHMVLLALAADHAYAQFRGWTAHFVCHGMYVWRAGVQFALISGERRRLTTCGMPYRRWWRTEPATATRA